MGPLLCLKGSELWAPNLKVVVNGIAIGYKGPEHLLWKEGLHGFIMFYLVYAKSLVEVSRPP